VAGCGQARKSVAADKSAASRSAEAAEAERRISRVLDELKSYITCKNTSKSLLQPCMLYPLTSCVLISDNERDLQDGTHYVVKLRHFDIAIITIMIYIATVLKSPTLPLVCRNVFPSKVEELC
jgi:hypothetical protein